MILGVERRPLLDGADLKRRYFERAAKVHPDSAEGDTEAFRDLQEAYRTLDDPVARLRALLDVCWPEADAAGPGPPSAGLFMEVGAALQAARSAWKKASAGGALTRVLAKEDLRRAQAGLRQAAGKVQDARSAWEEKLAGLDARWPEVQPGEVSGLAANGTFLARWQAELAETEFLLENG